MVSGWFIKFRERILTIFTKECSSEVQKEQVKVRRTETYRTPEGIIQYESTEKGTSKGVSVLN
jgi:hypothetical protein